MLVKINNRWKPYANEAKHLGITLFAKSSGKLTSKINEYSLKLNTKKRTGCFEENLSYPSITTYYYSNKYLNQYRHTTCSCGAVVAKAPNGRCSLVPKK